MPKLTVYLVDEQPTELSANRRALELILADVDIEVAELRPKKRLVSYNRLLASPSTVAFIIDQKLSVSGEVAYSGIELASHLRSINPKLPIYILTNYPDDHELSGSNERSVEDIIPKKDLHRAKSDEALRFKARFLRRLTVFQDVFNEREARFHALLTKSLKTALSATEQREMEVLQSARLAPVQAAELEDITSLGKSIEELKKVIETAKKGSGKKGED
jgi:DNA-binding NarL/FixJ family response regulator